MAKGKEIKRSKEETRAICLNYINEFTQENTDPSIKAEIIEEFQKETFWQRMGLKKVDKEGPLYGLAGKKMDNYRTDLKKILEKA